MAYQRGPIRRAGHCLLNEARSSGSSNVTRPFRRRCPSTGTPSNRAEIGGASAVGAGSTAPPAPSVSTVGNCAVDCGRTSMTSSQTVSGDRSRCRRRRTSATGRLTSAASYAIGSYPPQAHGLRDGCVGGLCRHGTSISGLAPRGWFIARAVRAVATYGQHKRLSRDIRDQVHVQVDVKCLHGQTHTRASWTTRRRRPVRDGESPCRRRHRSTRLGISQKRQCEVAPIMRSSALYEQLHLGRRVQP